MSGFNKYLRQKHKLTKIRERKKAHAIKLAADAIPQYLARKRRDFRHWKKATDAQLEQLKNKLPIEPPVWAQLKREQKIMFLIGARERRFFFMADTGVGKTLVAIALAMYFHQLGLVKRVMVLMPNRINKTDWWMEVEKHVKGKCSYTVLEGSSQQKLDALETTEALLIFETYGGLVRMCSELLPKKGKNKDKLEPDIRIVKWLRNVIDGGVLDESTFAGSRDSLTYRICRQIARNSAIFFEMSGMAFGRDPTPAWAQFYLVDGGETLGETLGLFRAVFFKTKETDWGDEYEFDDDKSELFNNVIANRSIRFEAKDLPPVEPIVKRIILPEDAEQYVAAAKRAIKQANGNPVVIENSFLRLRQISSGFIGFSDDTTGEKAKFVFDENPKLDMLLAILQTIREEHKCVVHFDFTFSGESLRDQINKALGTKALLLYGKTKDIDKVRIAFNDDPRARILLLQNRFGVGPNLQAAKYQIFYESPVSARLRRQCERRVERQYSTHDFITRYDLLCDGTADWTIYNYNKQGIDLFDRLVKGSVELE